jgi:hypothetical protein
MKNFNYMQLLKKSVIGRRLINKKGYLLFTYPLSLPFNGYSGLGRDGKHG